MDVDEVIQEQQPVTPLAAVQPSFVQPAAQPHNSSTTQPAPFPSVVTGFEFNIGAIDKATTPSKTRGRRTAGRKMCGSPTAGVRRRAPASQFAQGPQMPSEPHNFNDLSSENTASSTASADVFYEGNKAYVKSLREEARHFYMKEDYKSSVGCYTKALKVHTHDTGTLQETDDVRAVLLANRGAALMMMTAYWAAVHDCEEALRFISLGIGSNGHLPSDGGPILRCKVLIRLGRSHLKLGNLEQAERAFQLAAETESSARCFVTKGHNSEAYLAQTLTDASMGKTEAKQCRDLVRQLEQLEMTSLDSPITASRRNNLQALSLVNTALSMSSGSMDLHSMQVAILAALKRWREMAGCCERLAAELTRFDGVFNEDLAELNPFPGVSPATSLDPTFFEGDDIKVKKISSKKVVVDVVLRLPRNILRFYIRALRLEERYPLASAAITALEAHLSQNSANPISYAWLKREKDKLERTMKSKDHGDMLYVEGKYEAAMEFYSACMLIDGEGLPHDPSSEGSNGGGKLHAVLHCNRAACHMSTEKYLEAIKDCSMALRIHTHYMKAMLRRSRCYVRLARYEEATAEYERYIQLVSEYRKEGVYETTSCLFDGPKEVSSENLDAVKMELNEVRRSQVNQENAARAERAQKEQRQKWYSETFGKAKPGDDAQSRRDQWYSQQGANEPRRWDSFNGRGPHPNGNSGRGPSWRQHSNREDSSRREEPRSNTAAKPPSSPGSDTSKNHYSVLQLTVNATESEIKKGYRVMALKYHPDKNQDADASDMFRRIKLAYDVLSDPASRRQYDAENRFSRRF
jgi:tetratricopeptide (TPR) repeat protein